MNLFRKFLLPFAWIYGFVAFLRNKCYDKGIFKSYSIPEKSICIGNLSVGGTGKSPHVAYLAEHLKNHIPTAILSRGYGRKTKGFILASDRESATTIGDEPLMYFKRFGTSITVVVCENRKNGIKEIKQKIPENKLVILDDAFQHRAVKAGLNILLTTYHSPYFSDHVVPAGNLREWRTGRNRADCLVVTKCPNELKEEEKEKFRKKLKFHNNNIFFSSIQYGKLISFGVNKDTSFTNILLVTGIADPSQLFKHLKKNATVSLFRFPDHHEFNEADLHRIHQKFDTFATHDKVIVTTEKDFVRLADKKFKELINKYPWFYQEITIKIDQEEIFNKYIDQYVDTI